MGCFLSFLAPFGTLGILFVGVYLPGPTKHHFGKVVFIGFYMPAPAKKQSQKVFFVGVYMPGPAKNSF